LNDLELDKSKHFFLTSWDFSAQRNNSGAYASVYVRRDSQSLSFNSETVVAANSVILQLNKSNSVITSWKGLNILCRYKRVSL
jgi:hypothetical protein